MEEKEPYLQMLNLNCRCSSSECCYRLVIIKEDRELYFDLQSYNYNSIWKRIYEGFRYIFRRKNITWVSVLPETADIPRIIEFLNKLEGD